jgi:hypothetical protein
VEKSRPLPAFTFMQRVGMSVLDYTYRRDPSYNSGESKALFQSVSGSEAKGSAGMPVLPINFHRRGAGQFAEG